MGITVNKASSNKVFYNIDQKEGCFKTGSATKGNLQVFEPGSVSVTGVLTGFSVKPYTAPDGKSKETISLNLKDSDNPNDPDQVVSFTIVNNGDPSYSGLRLLSKLAAIDVTQPVSFSPNFFKAGTKFKDFVYDRDTAGVTVRQGGVSIKEDYGTPDNKLPERPVQMNAQGKPIMVQGKEVKDGSAWMELLDKQLGRLSSAIEGVEAPPEHHDEGVDENEFLGAAEAAESAAAVDRTPMRNRS